jgi:hypothetical protein
LEIWREAAADADANGELAVGGQLRFGN